MFAFLIPQRLNVGLEIGQQFVQRGEAIVCLHAVMVPMVPLTPLVIVADGPPTGITVEEAVFETML
jgi:hypothetical protein